jgi:hypothetical protein
MGPDEQRPNLPPRVNDSTQQPAPTSGDPKRLSQ